ncbi:hypothetical protein Tco_1284916 [Tanacetum coccineum]
MLESEAFKTYRAYATGEKAPKSKATKKKTDSESSLKTKPSQASKGKRIKNSAKGDKPSTTKLKGLTVLSEVALSEAEQMNQGEEEDKDDDEHNNEEEDEEHDSDDDNDDEDNDQENDSQITKSDDEGDDFVHLNLSTYIVDDQEKEKEEEKVDDDDDDVTFDQKVSTPLDYELTEEDENQEDDDTIGEDQEDEENGELYGDLNLNLDRQDAEMTDAQSNQEMEEAHVTLTTEPPVVQQQRTSVSSDLVAKFINPSPDTGIDSILNPNAAVSITPSSATIIPQTPIPIIQPQQQTHDSTTTITIPTTTVPEILNFASLFGFERRVSSLESDLSELKQTNQFAEAVASIPGIVDNYLTSKMKDEVNVALQLKSNKLREEAQAENQDFLNSLDSNMKRIIKEQVKAQTSKIMTKVEKYVTETLGAEVLVRSTNQPQTSYAVASSLSELELKKILMDKMEEKPLLTFPISGKEESSKEATQKKSKSTGSSKGNDDVSPVREATDIDERLRNPSGSRTPDREWNQTKTIDDRPPQQWMTKLVQALDLLTGPTYDLIKGTCKSVVELEYHLEEVFKATNDQLDWHNPEGRPYPHDLSKPLPLIPDARGRLIIPYDHFINNDLEYLKGEKLNALKFKERVSDLQLAVESYQKKINLTKPDTYRSDISKKTPYIAYRDIQSIIYQDDMNKNVDAHTMNHGPSDAMHNPSQPLKVGKTLFQNSRRFTHLYQLSYSELVDIEKVALSSSLRSLKLKCTIESKAKKISSINPYDTSGNPVKEVLLKLNLPDHRKLKDGGEVLKLKNFKKDATIKLFKSTNQEMYEHVGLEVTSSQDGKVTRWRNEIMLG